MKKRGKKYRTVLKEIDIKKLYNLSDGIELLIKTAITKFDSSAEVHVHLGIDPKQTEQNLRGITALPHGIGKEVKVIAFVPETMANQAKEAGAMEAGEDGLIEKISKGWLDFDKAVSVPEVMKKLGKVAKILGQKGLMPNPKSGTVTQDIVKAIQNIKKGQIEYRNDKLGNLHNIFGKISFGKEKLLENILVYLKTVRELKPSSLKGTYIESITLASTMGPGIKLDVHKVMQEV